MLNENRFYISDNDSDNENKKEKQITEKNTVSKTISSHNKTIDRIMTVGITLLCVKALFAAFLLGRVRN